jgi:hypothetical protein
MYRILVVFFVFISFRVFSISFDYDDLGRLSYSKDDYYVYDANNNLLTIGKDISGNFDDISFVEWNGDKNIFEYDEDGNPTKG